MTLQDLLDQWDASSADERFAAFLAWIEQDIDFVADLIGAIDVVRDAAASPILGNPEIGFRVDPDLFTDPAPNFAVAVGDFIIIAYLEAAVEKWEKQQKEIGELEKARQKYLDKLWEKLLKDAKPKGDPGYADWYYSYYLPKYYGEYGSP